MWTRSFKNASKVEWRWIGANSDCSSIFVEKGDPLSDAADNECAIFSRAELGVRVTAGLREQHNLLLDGPIQLFVEESGIADQHISE